MKLIREQIFETNSSSTNSFCLAEAKDNYIIPEKLTILDLYGGRDFKLSTVDQKFTCLAYICDIEEFFGLCYRLYEMGVKEIVLPHPDHFKYLRDKELIFINVGEIDDSYEDVCEILKDDEKIKRWLFDNNSYLSGHDNDFDY